MPDDVQYRTNPFLEHLQLPPVEVRNGIARLEFVVQEVHLRHGGVMHGGLFATVLDTVAGYTAYGVGPAGADLVTIAMNLNLTGTGKLGDGIIVTADVAHAGRRTAVIQGEIHRADGKLLGTGTITIFFISEGLVK